MRDATEGQEHGVLLHRVRVDLQPQVALTVGDLIMRWSVLEWQAFDRVGDLDLLRQFKLAERSEQEFAGCIAREWNAGTISPMHARSKTNDHQRSVAVAR